MNNDKILKNRWAEVDKKLSAFLKKYNRINKRTQDKLQQVFDGIDFTIEDANKYINQETREKFERQVEEFEEQGILKGYFGYNTKNVLRRSKIKNVDMLEVLIAGCYMLEMKSVNEIEMNLFKETTDEIYLTGIKEAEPKKKRNWVVPSILLATTLSLPNSKGYIWQEYKEGNAEYNAGQIKRQVLVNMQQEKPLDINDYEFQKIINSQNKRYINKKKTTNSQINLVVC